LIGTIEVNPEKSCPLQVKFACGRRRRRRRKRRRRRRRRRRRSALPVSSQIKLGRAAAAVGGDEGSR